MIECIATDRGEGVDQGGQGLHCRLGVILNLAESAKDVQLVICNSIAEPVARLVMKCDPMKCDPMVR